METRITHVYVLREVEYDSKLHKQDGKASLLWSVYEHPACLEGAANVTAPYCPVFHWISVGNSVRCCCREASSHVQITTLEVLTFHIRYVLLWWYLTTLSVTQPAATVETSMKWLESGRKRSWPNSEISSTFALLGRYAALVGTR
jgi:hypothetical protein